MVDQLSTLIPVGTALLGASAVLLVQRLQAKAAVASELRAREDAASKTAIDAVIRLQQLREPNDEEPDEAHRTWRRDQDHLRITLRTASLDLRPKDLRDRLAAADHILSNGYAAEHQGLPEWQSRTIACEEVLECLGAFRRGEPVPPTSKSFADALDRVDEWLEIERESYEHWKAQDAQSRQQPPAT